MSEFFLSVLKDGLVGILVAVGLAIVKMLVPKLAPFLGDEGVHLVEERSLGLDIGRFLGRMVLLVCAVWLGLGFATEGGDRGTVSMQAARHIGPWLPAWELSYSPFTHDGMKLVLLLIVPLAIVEGLISWPLRVWGASRGYKSKDFSRGVRWLAVLAAPWCVSAHLLYLYAADTSVGYGTSWFVTGIIYWGIAFLLFGWLVLLSGLKKKA